jgi:hypothetical protein
MDVYGPVFHVDESPKADLIFIPEYGEPRKNDNDRGNQGTQRKNLSQCHFVHYKSYTD